MDRHSAIPSDEARTSMPDPDTREYGAWLEQFADVMLPGLVVLDLGCGKGDDARVMASRGLSVVGLELSGERVKHAARRSSEACFIRASLAEPLPLRNNAVDIVTASLSLHYFDRQTTGAIVREIARVLRPEGVLLARVNVVGDVASGYGTGIEREPDLFEVEPGHLKRFFSEDSLRALLEPYFGIDRLFRQETYGRDHTPKQTIVVRARRRAERQA